jgi:hypothetical protein
MSKYLRFIAAAAVLTLAAAACGNNSASTSAGGGTGTGGSEPIAGGTLHAVMTQDFFHGLDPTQEYYSVSWQALRCCLARTLLSYNEKPSDEGGATPQPDIAKLRIDRNAPLASRSSTSAFGRGLP